ncbi:MAG: EMC3/TMCO1 family protein [Nanoarchaeota archaeon]
MNRGLRTLFIISFLGVAVAFFWNALPFIKESVHFVLNPTAGRLLDWDVSWGLLFISIGISLITSLLQKYTTDQETLRSIKAEQKLLGDQMKQFKEHPEKMLELQKKQMALIPKTMDITMRPALYTAIPFILLIRWFGDYFAEMDVKIFGFMGWIWAYIIFAIIASMIFRKVFKLP